MRFTRKTKIKQQKKIERKKPKFQKVNSNGFCLFQLMDFRQTAGGVNKSDPKQADTKNAKTKTKSKSISEMKIDCEFRNRLQSPKSMTILTIIANEINFWKFDKFIGFNKSINEQAKMYEDWLAVSRIYRFFYCLTTRNGKFYSLSRKLSSFKKLRITAKCIAFLSSICFT